MKEEIKDRDSTQDKLVPFYEYTYHANDLNKSLYSCYYSNCYI